MAAAGQRRSLVDRVVSAVRARGHEPVEVALAGDGPMIRSTVADALGRGVTLVVAVGGDGLVRETASPLSGGPASLAIVPAGTGNLLSSALGIPRDTAGALQVLAAGMPRTIDQGTAAWEGTTGGPGSGRFLVACGVGLDARLVAGASDAAKRRFGIAAYMGAALATAGDLRPRPTRLTVDGAVQDTRSVVVLVANAGELIPGVLGPRHPVRPDDGLLDVFVLHGGILGSLRGTIELLSARGPGAGRAGLRLQGTSVKVEIETPEPVQLDGDVLGTSPLEARVLPGALSVLGPS